MTTMIAVYADWDGLNEPQRLGRLYPAPAVGFEFDKTALDNPALTGLLLDPGLEFKAGMQTPPPGRDTFGMIADAAPGAWGRQLMAGGREREQGGQIDVFDHLLEIQDIFRSGALRFRLNDADDFLGRRDGALPPFVQLRQLEAASLAWENGEHGEHGEAGAGAGIAEHPLSLLMGAGGSFGGARPKAAVAEPSGHLWIAKFPSIHDEHDVGAWEIVVHTLARGCGLFMGESLAKRFSGDHHTFLARRFDRTESGRRLHFASAMTLTGHADGGNGAGITASGRASYLDIARVLIDHGAQTAADLRECWSRIVFNMLISNADDHLRNHGFILAPGKGWRLSEAYGFNPAPQSQALRLNVDESDNAMDLELARSVAHYFRLDAASADEIIERSRAVVRQWPKIATRLGIPLKEREWMRAAFRLA
ncbi:type II toxin-antitoxin system HipA family toxin [Oxalobacteraceae bacterium CAVE-383]|nr:type II toxin-antitoxin system HipA family toxin [Oxalobacteraceae bacterium CAVE-383]